MGTVQKPCVGCVYYTACGSTTRTMPCDGRMTKSERKMEEKKNGTGRKADDGSR